MSLRRMPLRRRVMLAFTLLGFCLSLVFSLAVIAVAEDYEHVLAWEILRGQAEDYGLRLANGLPAQLPLTHRLSGYRVDSPDLPSRYAHLPLGVQEDEVNDAMHIGVFDTHAGRLIFVVDLSDIETLERHLNWFLAGMIVLGTALSGWLGWWFAGRVLRPVSVLAGQVDALPVKPAPTQLAETVSRDELGRLAQAIDDYQGRLINADAREQIFFADASHELRTPLAVIQGVAEVLMDEPRGDAPYLARLQRLERAVGDMERLLNMLFCVARRSSLEWEDVDAQSFLLESAGVAARGLSLKADIQAAGLISVPRKEALLLLSGLMRKIAQQPDSVELHIRLVGSGLLIECPTQFPDIGDKQLRSDLGLGSALLDRLAGHIGWLVRFETPLRTRLIIESGTSKT